MLRREFYELYMSLLSSASESYRKDTVLTPFPPFFMNKDEKDFCIHHVLILVKLSNTINTMPSSDQLFGTQKSLQIDQIKLDTPILELIRWMVKTEEKFTLKYIDQKSQILKSLVSMKQVPTYALPDHVYEISYRDAEHFDNEMKKYGEIIGFHGSSLENWYSILHNSLQNYSFTKKMKNGAVFGDGVYFCEDIVVAHDFLVPGDGWKHSNLGKNIGVVCVCEIIKHPNVTISKENIGISKSTKVTPDFLNLEFLHYCTKFKSY